MEEELKTSLYSNYVCSVRVALLMPWTVHAAMQDYDTKTIANYQF